MATAKKAVKKSPAKKAATALKKTASKKKAAPKKTASKKAAPKKRAPAKAATNKTGTKKSAVKKSTAKKTPRKWSARVTATSDAMDLQQRIFTSKDPKKIARSVKKSAEKSNRRKAGPFQSAMSMINFYENRGGKNLTATERKTLDKAKEELRKLFGREE